MEGGQESGGREMEGYREQALCSGGPPSSRGDRTSAVLKIITGL